MNPSSFSSADPLGPSGEMGSPLHDNNQILGGTSSSSFVADDVGGDGASLEQQNRLTSEEAENEGSAAARRAQRCVETEGEEEEEEDASREVVSGGVGEAVDSEGDEMFSDETSVENPLSDKEKTRTDEEVGSDGGGGGGRDGGGRVSKLSAPLGADNNLHWGEVGGGGGASGGVPGSLGNNRSLEGANTPQHLDSNYSTTTAAVPTHRLASSGQVATTSGSNNDYNRGGGGGSYDGNVLLDSISSSTPVNGMSEVVSFVQEQTKRDYLLDVLNDALVTVRTDGRDGVGGGEGGRRAVGSEEGSRESGSGNEESSSSGAPSSVARVEGSETPLTDRSLSPLSSSSTKHRQMTTSDAGRIG